MGETFQEKGEPEVICRVVPRAVGNTSRTREKEKGKKHCLDRTGQSLRTEYLRGLETHLKLSLHRTALPAYPVLPLFTWDRRTWRTSGEDAVWLFGRWDLAVWESCACFSGWCCITSLRKDPVVKGTGFGTRQTSATYQGLTEVLGLRKQECWREVGYTAQGYWEGCSGVSWSAQH